MKKKPPLLTRYIKKSYVIYMAIGAILIGFATWVFMKAGAADNDLVFTATYNLPDFASLENLYQLESGNYAAAIDGEIVSGKHSQDVHPTASTAKMILGLAIMQEKPFGLGEPGETITIGEEYYNLYQYYTQNGGSVSAVEDGEKISEYDALMSVFLVSSNNMADTLALWAFGSMENYQDYATEMLKSWGINNTTIGIDASGFDESTTSNASDLAKIAQHVMQDSVLREIVNTKEYTVPVAGDLENTNKILGQNNISGVKTGYIGDASGYCLVSGYMEDEHIVTVALTGSYSREDSFDDSLGIVRELQEKVPLTKLVSAGEEVGYYDSWWTGRVAVTADRDIYGLGWADAVLKSNIEMNGRTGTLKIAIGAQEYAVEVSAGEYQESPNIIERIRHAFGWTNSTAESIPAMNDMTNEPSDDTASETTDELETFEPITSASSENCTIKLGTLMLINPNFIVEDSFIADRRTELVSISSLYGIVEGNPGNGDNLLDEEAAVHINDMIKAYEAEYPGHTMETRSCFRAVGTQCGRLCAATGTSDHHTGLTCDLLDPEYGTELNTDYYDRHVDWQWLKANSYKYGFIDRFPEAWAGGSMNEPINVDENGSTGLYETWHYRYVGIPAATDIATGKYNNGEYDSLEHYLKARGLVQNLKAGTCQ